MLSKRDNHILFFVFLLYFVQELIGAAILAIFYLIGGTDLEKEADKYSLMLEQRLSLF